MRRYLAFRVVALCVFITLGPAFTQAGTSGPRISKEELRPLLGSPDLVIIDIRTKAQWEESDKKLPKAVHEPPFEASTWGPKYPQDKIIVTYCS
mgnify:CR=1 FL=1